MALEFFKRKENPEAAIPEDVRKNILSVRNNQGVLHQLKDSSYLARDKEEWKKDLSQKIDAINQALSEGKIPADVLSQWMKEKQYSPRSKETLDGLLWLNVDVNNRQLSVELNNLFPLRGVAEKAKLLAENEKIPGTFYLPLLNGEIGKLVIKPKPGELDRWLKSSGLDQYYQVQGEQLELKTNK